MKNSTIAFILSLGLFSYCSQHDEKSENQSNDTTAVIEKQPDSSKLVKDGQTDSLAYDADIAACDSVKYDPPIIAGHFTSRAELETYSAVLFDTNGTPLSYLPDCEDYMESAEATTRKSPTLYLLNETDSIFIHKGQVFGVIYFKNEGDVNNDGLDDIGYIGDWADLSNLNSYKLLSWNGSEWITILDYQIHEGMIEESMTDGRMFETLSDSTVKIMDYEAGEFIEKVVTLKK